MKDRKISIRINEEQYKYLSDKGKISRVLSDIIDRDMADCRTKSNEMSDKKEAVPTKIEVPPEPKIPVPPTPSEPTTTPKVCKTDFQLWCESDEGKKVKTDYQAVVYENKTGKVA